MPLPIRPVPHPEVLRSSAASKGPRAPRRPFTADLRLGDRVRPLVSFDTMLVVDLDGPMVTAARRTPAGVSELTLTRACFRKFG